MSTHSKSKQVRSVKKQERKFCWKGFWTVVILAVLGTCGGFGLVHYVKTNAATATVDVAPEVQTVFSDSCKRRISEAWTNGYNAAKND